MGIEISNSASALSAFGTAIDATAHNVANVSTEDYRPLRTDFSEGAGGQGVQASVSRTGTGLERSPTSSEPGTGLIGVSSLLGQGNGVDIASEMIGLMVNERAYSANATFISSVEQTTGRVMDLIA